MEVTVRTLVACLILVVAGCFESAQRAEIDAEIDAGQADSSLCECSEGPCCDGCYFRPADVVCIAGGMIGPATCLGWSDINCPGDRLISSPLGDRYCSGTSADCAGLRVPNGNAAVTGDCGSVFPYGAPDRALRYCVEDDSALGATCVLSCQ